METLCTFKFKSRGTHGQRTNNKYKTKLLGCINTCAASPTPFPSLSPKQSFSLPQPPSTLSFSPPPPPPLLSLSLSLLLSSVKKKHMNDSWVISVSQLYIMWLLHENTLSSANKCNMVNVSTYTHYLTYMLTGDDINVNVKDMLIVQISPWVQQPVQFTPLVLEHTLLQSHLLWGG